MGKIIKTNGEITDYFPTNKIEFSLEELSSAVGGHIEIVTTMDEKHYMILNEEGKLNDLPINHKATEMFSGNKNGFRDMIVGDVVLCTSKEAGMEYNNEIWNND